MATKLAAASARAVQPLDQIRYTIGKYNFAANTSRCLRHWAAGPVKAAWFRHYAADEALSFERIVQSWNTASNATELSDYSVCTSWGLSGKDLYLLDVLRRRMEYPELKRALRAQYERFRPSVVLVEDKASGTQLIQELIAEGLYAVTLYQPQSDRSCALGVAKGNACRVKRSFASSRPCTPRPR